MIATARIAPALPEPEVLARMINAVTRTMFGITFDVSKGAVAVPSMCWRVAALTIGGHTPMRIAIASDEASCTELASVMFGCTPDGLDDSMIEDALRELVNMSGGQIKNVVAPDVELTVPKMISADDLLGAPQMGAQRDVVLRAERLALVLSIHQWD